MATTLGIDIAYEALKITGLERNGSKHSLIGINYSPIPKDSWTADELKNREEIAATLRKALTTAKPRAIPAENAMIALPESTVYSTFFTVPGGLKRSELLNTLPYEVADRLSINFEEYIIDFELTASACRPTLTTTNLKSPSKEAAADNDKNKPEPDSAKIENKAEKESETTAPGATVLAVAAKRTLIESLVELCGLAKIELNGVDIKAAAIARAVAPIDDKKIRLIVDLGANTTSATVCEGNSPRLVSSIPLGTHNYLVDKDKVVANFKEVTAPIFDELVHVNKFFENRICPGHKIEEINLIGGGSVVPTIFKLFEDETNLTVRLSNPFQTIDTHRFPLPTDLAHKFADSVGLAMRPIK